MMTPEDKNSQEVLIEVAWQAHLAKNLPNTGMRDVFIAGYLACNSIRSHECECKADKGPFLDRI